MNINNCYTQTDPRWSDIEMKEGTGRKIKQDFCLGTAINNCLRDYSPEYEYLTPTLLDSFLDKHNGYTENGYIIWSPLEIMFKFSQKKHEKPYSNLKFSNDPKRYWIVQVPYQNTGHFCNVIAVKNNIITYFDTYDGKLKEINLNDTISIREIVFK